MLSPADALLDEIQKWNRVDGAAFHRLLQKAEELNLLDHGSACVEFGVSPSTVRNWISGSLRPSSKAQSDILLWLSLAIQGARLEADEEPPFEESSVPASTVESAAYVPEAFVQLADIAGNSYTVDITTDGITWRAAARELPDIVAESDSRIGVFLDLKALVLDLLDKRSPVADNKSAAPQ
jgi:hypothetical protein